jgi:hypothetical protein
MPEPFSKQFRLSITKALGDQLAEELAALTPTPLTRANLAKLDDQAKEEKLSSKSGVYQLYLNAPGKPEPDLVYVGKADEPLARRLGQHHTKISGRKGISVEEISFKCLYVAEDFSAVAPERLLIKKYKQIGHIPWNANGFGNKDPGTNRDRTTLKRDHFDVLYPIDLDRRVSGLTPGEGTLASLLTKAKDALPYNFRYKDVARHQEVSVTVPSEHMTAHDIFTLIARHLPETWQIAALMGYVIMYPDKHASYASAFRYYRGTNILEAKPKLKPVGKKQDELDEEDEDSEEGQ